MKEKKYLILGIATVLITLIGVTYAYFTTKIIGDRKNVTVDMAELKIIFTNGDAIEASEVYAEDNLDIIKTFSVENKTKNEYKYNIVIEDLVNTFKTTGYLVYKITSDDGGYNMTDFEDVPKSLSAENVVLAYNVNVPAKSIHNYSIEIKYINDEEYSQDEDQGAKLSGKLYIEKGYKTLYSAMLDDNPTISERTDFSVTNTENTTGTIYKTNKTEDDSYVYYYSGNTTNNWVKFGKETIQECTYDGEQVQYGIYNESTNFYKEVRKIVSSDECVSTNVCVDKDYGPVVGLTEEQCNEIHSANQWTTDKATSGAKVEKDIYWRIIRTNEDGSVRLLYLGLDTTTTKGYIGGSAFNSNYNNPMYVGYMYGTTDSLDNNRTNENDSDVKTLIDTWYENTLLNKYDKYISKTAIYCNDRSVGDGEYNTSLAGYFGYGTYKRSWKYIPTYKCGGDGTGGLFESTQAVEDKFSASTVGGGNGQLKYPIALITADEVSFAGGRFGSSLSSPYAWYYTNSDGNAIFENLSWYTLSPVQWNNIRAGMLYISSSSLTMGHANSGSVMCDMAIRPVISLSKCVKIKSGNGTPDSPYEIDYDNSCN